MFMFLQRSYQRWRRSPRVYIVPTKVGYSYVLFIVLMLLGAINYNNSLGHLLCFLLVGLGHVAMHHSYRNLQQIKVNVAPAEPVFCGQPIKLNLSLSHSQHRTLHHIKLSHLNNTSPARWKLFKSLSHSPTEQIVAWLNANAISQTTLSLPTKQRGWMSVGQLRLSSVYPLGLFFSWFLIDADKQILVYPHPQGDRPFPETSSTISTQPFFSQQGQDDFVGFQRYRSGDAKHHVAWKALARDNVMRTKQFSQSHSQIQVFDWQAVAELADIEQKLSQLCQWITQAATSTNSYGLNLPGQIIQPDSGAAHYHQCLKALALYEAS